jgi:hypothetical protein
VKARVLPQDCSVEPERGNPEMKWIVFCMAMPASARKQLGPHLWSRCTTSRAYEHYQVAATG